MKIEDYNTLFDTVVERYHFIDDVNQSFRNPHKGSSIQQLLYTKCWIDTVQWHCEDIIRLPGINPIEALALKRRIDASNQDRTDVVEYIDKYFLNIYKNVVAKKGAKINTESPAWAIDRLSILALKIYHMKEEATRISASDKHRNKCQKKLAVLLEQREDLTMSISELMQDFETGDKYMKVYKQMKMYNDNELNPMLYKKE